MKKLKYIYFILLLKSIIYSKIHNEFSFEVEKNGEQCFLEQFQQDQEIEIEIVPQDIDYSKLTFILYDEKKTNTLESFTLTPDLSNQKIDLIKHFQESQMLNLCFLVGQKMIVRFKLESIFDKTKHLEEIAKKKDWDPVENIIDEMVLNMMKIEHKIITDQLREEKIWKKINKIKGKSSLYAIMTILIISFIIYSNLLIFRFLLRKKKII